MNLLGQREPLLYGSESFEVYFNRLKDEFADVRLAYGQYNQEGQLVEAIQEAGESCDGVVLNPAAYTHTSIAVADAVAAIEIPVVEVHISKIDVREAFRKESYVSKYVVGKLSGFGLDGYRMAIDYLLRF